MVDLKIQAVLFYSQISTLAESKTSNNNKKKKSNNLCKVKLKISDISYTAETHIRQ